MKKKFLLTFLILGFLTSLASCGKDKEETEISFSGYEFENPDAIKQTSGTSQINIFGVNDFHGAVNEDYKQIGIAKLGTFIKQKVAQENTLFIDIGDTWQGSLESNYNKGKLINEVYNNAGISARVVGNHDFDWGLETLENNIKNSSFPNLASNVFDFDWNTKEIGESQQSQFGKDYVTYVLDNGLKIGIIGTIGEDQISSISSQLVKTISFTKQGERIKKVSDYLRTTKNCDLVIAAAHASMEQMPMYDITSISSVSHKKYVDLVLNAHTHRSEKDVINNVTFAQFGGYGEEVGKVSLQYDFDRNELITTSTKVYHLSKLSVTEDIHNQIDSEIQTIVDRYNYETSTLGSEIITENLNGSFYSGTELPNLMAEAIFTESVNEGYTVDFAYTNYARASHYNTTMTYSDLYTCFPFDNEIYILEVTGKEAANMLRFQNFVYNNFHNSITYNGVYKIAILDYLGFHTDNSRNLDYFPNQKVLGKLTKDGKIYTYREILKDYLQNNPAKTFFSSDYSPDCERFTR